MKTMVAPNVSKELDEASAERFRASMIAEGICLYALILAAVVVAILAIFEIVG